MQLNVNDLSDRYLLLALFTQTMKRDPQFKAELLRCQLEDRISLSWLDQVHRNNLWTESVECVVTTTDDHIYRVRVAPTVVEGVSIEAYRDNVIEPQTRLLVNMITKDFPDLSVPGFDIKSIELAKSFCV